MGLDAVEIVLRCEEVFAISIPDEDAERVQTVCGLYRLICSSLGLPTDLRFPIPGDLPPLPPPSRKRQRMIKLNLNPNPQPHWTPEAVWNSLIAILCDQLQVRPADLWYEARFTTDLGVD